MRVLLFGGMAALVSLAVLCGCGPEPAVSPIEPAGELADVFAAVADDEYLAVGYLDIESGLNSEVGRTLISRLEPVQQWMDDHGISLEELVSEVGVAVRFDSRSYPNYYRSLRLIAVARTGLNDVALQQILDSVEHQTEEINSVEVHQLSTSVPGLSSGDPFWLTMPQPGLLVIGTFRDLLEGSLEALAGKRVSLKNGESMRTLLAKVDKESTGWLAIRHSVRSRNLLQFMAPFDDCIVRLNLADKLSIICAMEFNVAEEARIAVDGFMLSRRQMRDLAESFPETDASRATGGKALLEAIGHFKARQEGRLAVFSAEFDAGWFEEHWPRTNDLPSSTGSDDEVEQ